MSSKTIASGPRGGRVQQDEGSSDGLDEELVGSDDPTFAALLNEVARAPAAATERTLAAGDRVGEHQIADVVGKGAFGTVYRAVHPVLGSQVAIKVLSSVHAADPGVAARFIEEARAIHRIRHPNIVTLHGFGELANGQLYYAMELLEGKTLAAHLAERGAFAPELALVVLRQVADALDAAHGHGVLHRDLKPDNIFVVGELGPGCTVKLLDFGIAKVLGEESALRTRTGMLIGTPAYMSPEQCGGEPVDAKSDIYALGVIGHELFTGARLFPTGNVRETMAHHMFETPKPVSSIVATLPSELDRVLLAMLAKRPDKRPASATAAVDELARALSAKPSRLPRGARLWWALATLLALLSLWSARRYLGAAEAEAPAALPAPAMQTAPAPPPAASAPKAEPKPQPVPTLTPEPEAPPVERPQARPMKPARPAASDKRSRGDLEF